MADLNLDRPERPDSKSDPRRYAIVDQSSGAIVATHDEEYGAEREVIAAGNPHLVILDLEEPPDVETLRAPSMSESQKHDVLGLVEPVARAA